MNYQGFLAGSMIMAAPFALSREAVPSTTVTQSLCPVMEGRQVIRSRYVDYEGERIYVCCVPCVKAVRKDPARYRDKLHAQGVILEKVGAGRGGPGK